MCIRCAIYELHVECNKREREREEREREIGHIMIFFIVLNSIKRFSDFFVSEGENDTFAYLYVSNKQYGITKNIMIPIQ